MKLITLVAVCLVTISIGEAYAGDCSDKKAGNRAECPQFVCPPELKKITGAWIGREKVEIEGDIVVSEAQLLFSLLGCQAGQDGAATQSLIGREHAVIQAGRNSAKRTAIKPVVIYKGLRPEGVVEGALVVRVGDVRLYRKGKKQFLRLKDESFEFEKLETGHVAYFSGKAWTVTSSGQLIGATNFVVKSTSDPATDSVHETLVYQSPKEGAQPAIELSVLDVSSELLGGAQLERVLGKIDGTRELKVFERQSNGKLFREERFLVSNKVAYSQFKTGEQISRSEFNSKIQKILTNEEIESRPITLP